MTTELTRRVDRQCARAFDTLAYDNGREAYRLVLSTGELLTFLYADPERCCRTLDDGRTTLIALRSAVMGLMIGIGLYERDAAVMRRTLLTYVRVVKRSFSLLRCLAKQLRLRTEDGETRSLFEDVFIASYLSEAVTVARKSPAVRLVADLGRDTVRHELCGLTGALEFIECVLTETAKQDEIIGTSVVLTVRTHKMRSSARDVVAR